MTKWQYKIVKINVTRYTESDMQTVKLQATLDEHGQEGWEVINIFDLNSADGHSSNVIVSMKRPVE